MELDLQLQVHFVPRSLFCASDYRLNSVIHIYRPSSLPYTSSALLFARIMALAVGAAIIGVVDLVFSAIPVFEKLFASPEDFTHTVRITLGSNATLDASLGGNVPGVALWDEFGRSIGGTKSEGKKAGQGGFRDISVVANGDVDNITPAYLSIVAGGVDAVCIATVTVTAADGSRFTWGGDVAKACGETAFFISNNPAGPGYTPHCIFIDRDGTTGIKHQGIGIHLDDFFADDDQVAAYAANTDLMCKSGPRFRLYEKLDITDPILVFDPPLEKHDNRTDVDPGRVIGAPGVFAEKPKFKRKRGTLGLNTSWYDSNSSALAGASTGLSEQIGVVDEPIWKWEGQVVVTHMRSHSAEALCQEKMSWGPDVAAVPEGKFCSMKDKTLYDICSEKISSCCFDVDQKQMRSCTGNTFAKVATVAETATAVYDNVSEWFDEE